MLNIFKIATIFFERVIYKKNNYCVNKLYKK